jgi:6-pyruvoyltetrahydropterin/6-carboxytetrahydropterin synthase
MIQQFYPQTLHPYSYELNKDMHLAAAHFIPQEKAGACHNVHGHTYFINLTIAGDDLDELGFLVDFKAVKDLIHKRYDHSLLNDQQHDFNSNDPNFFPTSEVLARTIWKLLQDYLDQLPNQPKCIQVILRETPTSYVVYRPKGNTR